MSKELAKTYDPKGLEDRLYQKWLDSGYFHAKVNKAKKPFTIVMPPPNVTGQLHMGHALDETMQDILIRFKRMQGYEALWQPGTDHAAIATEVKVINKLKEQGIDKNEIGREEFLKHAWAWKEEYGGKIINQLKKLGASADWERERFTMDEGCSKAVQEVFIRLYNKGYIYKGSRIINWCPVCQTSISDAEVEHEDQDGFFWHINYPVVGEEGKFVEIATTRPETLLGDTAVAVNPEDDRYKDLVGKMLKLPLTDREIPVIADAYVDKEFGTGCVKITPAHDPNDFEVGKRHNLEEINILKAAGLSDVSFELVLPQVSYPFSNGGAQSAAYYLSLFERLKVSKTPFQFILNRQKPGGGMFHYTNLTVGLETYEITDDAGEGFDVKVKINLKQYRAYGTKTVTVQPAKTSGGTATATVKAAPRPTTTAPKAATYTVKSGDCLWNIAKKQLGNGADYTKIYNLNKDKIKNPNLIYPGQVLTLPS